MERLPQNLFLQEEEIVQKIGLYCLAFAITLVFNSSPAVAAPKTVSYSICAGTDCHNGPSQHNFTSPGKVHVPTGLPSGFKIQSLTYSCAAFCSHSALWPKIYLAPGHDGSYFTLDARHNGSVNANSSARATTYTLNVWIRY